MSAGATDVRRPTLAAALLELLDELASLLDRLTDEQYTAPAPGRSSGSIGAHVRHCLDHVAAVLEAERAGRCCYDHRERGTAVERRKEAALERIAALASRVARVRSLDREVVVDTQLDTAGTMTPVRSTLARELAFVISHTVHHNATIGLMLQVSGMRLPDRYGVAVSTPTVLERLSCAP